MSEKREIRIVKRSERAQQKPNNSRTARKTATEMVNTVTSWVSEFQERQRADTAKAIDNLIRTRQQPTEA